MQKGGLGAFEKDILTEIGSMCAGNATTALAQILGKRIELEVPSVKIVSLKKLPWYVSSHPEEIIVGVHMQILGMVRGNALLIFPKRNAFILVDLLIGPLEEIPSGLTEMGISALKEMGSIVISAYLSALSAFTGISIFPSTVTLSSGPTKSFVKLIFSGLKKENSLQTILIEAFFREEKRGVSGNFFVIFDAISIKAILKRAKGLVKQRK